MKQCGGLRLCADACQFCNPNLEDIEFVSMIQSHVNKEQIKRDDVFPSSMCSQLVNLMLPIDADSCCTVWF